MAGNDNGEERVEFPMPPSRPPQLKEGTLVSRTPNRPPQFGKKGRPSQDGGNGGQLMLASDEEMRRIRELVKELTGGNADADEDEERRKQVGRLIDVLNARIQQLQQQGQQVQQAQQSELSNIAALPNGPTDNGSGNLPVPVGFTDDNEEGGDARGDNKAIYFPVGVGPYPYNEAAHYMAKSILYAVAKGDKDALNNIRDHADAIFDFLYPYYDALYNKYGDNSLYGKALSALIDVVGGQQQSQQAQQGRGQPAGAAQQPSQQAQQQTQQAPTAGATQQTPSQQTQQQPTAQQTQPAGAGQQPPSDPQRRAQLIAVAADYAALLHAKEKIFKVFMGQRFKDALDREAEIVDNFQRVLTEIGEEARVDPARAQRELELLFNTVRERYNEYAGGLLWRLRTRRATWARLAAGVALTAASFFVGGPVLAGVVAAGAALRGLGVFTATDAVGDLAHIWQASRDGIGGRVGAQILYRRDISVDDVVRSFNSAATRDEVRQLAVELSTKPVQVAKDAMWVRIVKRVVGAVAAVVSALPFVDKLLPFAHKAEAAPIPVGAHAASATGTPEVATASLNAPDPFNAFVDKGDGVYHLSKEMVDKAMDSYGIVESNVDKEAMRVVLMRDLINEADKVTYNLVDANGKVVESEALSNVLEMVKSDAAVKWHGLPKDVWIMQDPSATPGKDVVIVGDSLREKYSAFMEAVAEKSKAGKLSAKEIFALAREKGLKVGNFIKNPPSYLA